jgi:hypothetical protein
MLPLFKNWIFEVGSCPSLQVERFSANRRGTKVRPSKIRDLRRPACKVGAWPRLPNGVLGGLKAIIAGTAFRYSGRRHAPSQRQSSLGSIACPPITVLDLHQHEASRAMMIWSEPVISAAQNPGRFRELK